MITLGKKIRQGMGDIKKNMGKFVTYGLIGAYSLSCAPIPAQPSSNKPAKVLTEEEKLALEIAQIEDRIMLAKLGLAFGKTNNELLLSQLFLDLENSRYQMALVKAGRNITNINIDNNSGGKSDNYDPRQTNELENYIDPYYEYFVWSEGTSPPPSFVCEGWKDFNNNGTLEKEELINYSYYFNNNGSKQRFMIGASWENAVGTSILLKIINHENNKIINSGNFGKIQENGQITSIFLDIEKNNLSEIREYRIEWYMDGKLMPSRTRNFMINYNP